MFRLAVLGFWVRCGKGDGDGLADDVAGDK